MWKQVVNKQMIKASLVFFLLILSFESFAQEFEGYGLFVDPRDGKNYLTVKIGNQTWMAENLSYKTPTGSWVYNKDQSFAEDYGRLYNWETSLEACPAGWHLPGDEEWMALEIYLGMDPEVANLTGWRGKTEGSKIKATNGWDYGGNGTNKTGFSALPAGFKDGRGGFGGKDIFAYFWTSSELDNGVEAWTRKLYHPTRAIGRSNYDKKYYFSVRCVKDVSSISE